MAFYLKYRPQSLDQLDLVKVRNRLQSILGGKTVPHAFLFVGPKGTGKTSSARILAKVVNCLKPAKAGKACNRCEACKLINEGQPLDLIEIDAASNRGIDDIRELKERINLVPSKLKYKVYIIDEAHMLTPEAFNALLKTLEEPPDHVKFVLCTTEPQKLPETIVSRCVKVDFAKADLKELKAALSKVVKGEKLKIGEEALTKIAQASDGSFRDAVKTLEILAASGKSISVDKVNELLGTSASQKDFDDWLVAIYQGEAAKALTRLQEMTNQGSQPRYLTLKAIERLREVMLQRLKVFSGNDLPAIDNLNSLRQLTDLLHRAGRETKTAVIDSLPLELAIVSWAQVLGSNPPPVAGDGDQLASKPAQKTGPVKVRTASGKLKLNKVRNLWPEILKAMRPHNHSLEALLRSAQPQGFEGQFLVINVFYQFHKERLEVDRYRQLVEQVLTQKLGKPIKVKYLLGSKSDNLKTTVDDDIIKTAEEIFGSDLN